MTEVDCKTTPAGSYSPIGSVVPERCRRGSYTPTPGLAQCLGCDAGEYQNETGATECVPCKRGHFCSTDQMNSCAPNTYNPNVSSYLVTDCQPCPSLTTTGESFGVEDVDGCACNVGFYRDAAGACIVCPLGTECEATGAGLTVRTLPLKRGYYRLSGNTSDVRRCPDASAGCVTSECPNTTSGCRGGSDADLPCMPGLTGPFCRLCSNENNDSLTFYEPASDLLDATCRPCSEIGQTAESLAGLIAMSMVAVVVLMATVVAFLSKAARGMLRTGWTTLARRYSVPTKLKILIGFYQITCKVPAVYGVFMPNDVRKLLDSLTLVVSFGIEGLPMACLPGTKGHLGKMLAWFLGPYMTVLVIFGATFIFEKRRRDKKIRRAVELAGAVAKRLGIFGAMAKETANQAAAKASEKAAAVEVAVVAKAAEKAMKLNRRASTRRRIHRDSRRVGSASADEVPKTETRKLVSEQNTPEAALAELDLTTDLKLLTVPQLQQLLKHCTGKTAKAIRKATDERKAAEAAMAGLDLTTDLKLLTSSKLEQLLKRFVSRKDALQLKGTGADGAPSPSATTFLPGLAEEAGQASDAGKEDAMLEIEPTHALLPKKEATIESLMSLSNEAWKVEAGNMIFEIKLSAIERSLNEIVLERAAPLALYLVFLAYPIVTNVAFEAFSCYRFDASTVNGTTTYGSMFLIADVSVECGTSEHDAILVVATLAITVQVGLLAFNAYQLFQIRHEMRTGDVPRREEDLSLRARATLFLHREYKENFFWWELAEMVRRFLLVGLFVVWPYERGTVMQLALAVIICIAYMAVQLHACPYRLRSNDYFGLIASFLLTMVFVTCVFYKYESVMELDDIQNKLSPEQRDVFDVYTVPLSMMLFGSIIGVIVAGAGIVLVHIAYDARLEQLAWRGRLRYKKGSDQLKGVDAKADTPVQLPLPDRNGKPAKKYHVFLSHTQRQAAGQDQMRIVKQRLKTLLPECEIFLDVDDLYVGFGGEAVRSSHIVLVMPTEQYFASLFCVYELFEAILSGIPIITLLEYDSSDARGGMSEDALRQTLGGSTPWPHCNAPQSDKTLLQVWAEQERDAEKRKWIESMSHRLPGDTVLRALLPRKLVSPFPTGGGQMRSIAPSAAALYTTSMPPIEWNRIGVLQDATMCLLAARVAWLLQLQHHKEPQENDAAKSTRPKGMIGVSAREKVAQTQTDFCSLAEFERSVYVRSDMFQAAVEKQWRLPPAVQKGRELKFHLYVSKHDKGGELLAKELQEVADQIISKASADEAPAVTAPAVAPTELAHALAESSPVDAPTPAPSAAPGGGSKGGGDAGRCGTWLAACGRNLMKIYANATARKEWHSLEWTTDFKSLGACHMMLLSMSKRTWRLEAGEVDTNELESEVMEALKLGVGVLLVWELPSALDEVEVEERLKREADKRETAAHLKWRRKMHAGGHRRPPVIPRYGVDTSGSLVSEAAQFGDIFSATPQAVRDNNLYGSIAIAIKVGEWRKAGLVKALHALSRNDGKRTKLDLDKQERRRKEREEFTSQERISRELTAKGSAYAVEQDDEYAPVGEHLWCELNNQHASESGPCVSSRVGAAGDSTKLSHESTPAKMLDDFSSSPNVAASKIDRAERWAEMGRAEIGGGPSGEAANLRPPILQKRNSVSDDIGSYTCSHTCAPLKHHTINTAAVQREQEERRIQRMGSIRKKPLREVSDDVKTEGPGKLLLSGEKKRAESAEIARRKKLNTKELLAEKRRADGVFTKALRDHYRKRERHQVEKQVDKQLREAVRGLDDDVGANVRERLNDFLSGKQAMPLPTPMPKPAQLPQPVGSGSSSASHPVDAARTIGTARGKQLVKGGKRLISIGGSGRVVHALTQAFAAPPAARASTSSAARASTSVANARSPMSILHGRPSSQNLTVQTEMWRLGNEPSSAPPPMPSKDSPPRPPDAVVPRDTSTHHLRTDAGVGADIMDGFDANFGFSAVGDVAAAADAQNEQERLAARFARGVLNPAPSGIAGAPAQTVAQASVVPPASVASTSPAPLEPRMGSTHADERRREADGDQGSREMAELTWEDALCA